MALVAPPSAEAPGRAASAGAGVELEPEPAPESRLASPRLRELQAIEAELQVEVKDCPEDGRAVLQELLDQTTRSISVLVEEDKGRTSTATRHMSTTVEPTLVVEAARCEGATDQLAAGLDQAKQFQEERAAAVHGQMHVMAGGERFTLKSKLSRQLMQEALALEQLEE
jgi:hypothetical protein